jgi:hypothetical protein
MKGSWSSTSRWDFYVAPLLGFLGISIFATYWYWLPSSPEIETLNDMLVFTGYLMVPIVFYALGAIFSVDDFREASKMRKDEIAIRWTRSYRQPSGTVSQLVEEMLKTEGIEYSKEQRPRPHGVGVESAFSFTALPERRLVITILPNDEKDTSTWLELTSSRRARDDASIRGNIDVVIAEATRVEA